MLKFLLLLTTSLYALNITLSTGSEHFNTYSILHIRDSTKFLCTKEQKQLICIFSKKPTSTIEPIQNNFFQISSKIQNDRFFLIIKPIKKLFFMPIAFNLTKAKTVYKTDISLFNNWLIVGYKNKLPFISQNQTKGLKLPITFTNFKLPYIGALDMYGRPIHIKQLKDIELYMKIKSAYKNQKYNDVLPLINEALSKYPNSIFNSQYLFYKIKIYSKLHDDAYLVSISRKYLRKYSGTKHVSQILLLTANAYLALKSKSMSNYFYDRLLTEHADSKYAKLALINFGDQFLKAHQTQKALNYYAKALNTTRNLDIASLAAYKIAMYGLQHNLTTDAISYINKILNANPKFFVNQPIDAIKLAKILSKNKKYLLAIKIIQTLLTSQPSKYYQLLLKDKGIWLVKANRKKEAIKVLDLYISKFAKGDYINIVKKTKYSLFFNENDKNSTKILKHYDYLIKKYQGQNIAKKALQKKIKLLFRLRKYSAILALNLKNQPKIISKSATAFLNNLLDKHKCYQAIGVYKKYHIKLTHYLDNQIFTCAIKTLHYKIAKTIANKHVKSTVLTQRMKWMYRLALSDFRLEKFHQVIKIGNDLNAILKNMNKSQYDNIYRLLFDANAKLKNHIQMIIAIKMITKKFGISYIDIMRYMQMINLGVSQKDNNIVMIYGNYVYNLQNKVKVYQQSPYLEFTLAQAYINDNHIKIAIKILNSLNKLNLSPSQKSRQKYILGLQLQKLWQNKAAQDAFKQSVTSDKSSPWALLSKDALKLL